MEGKQLNLLRLGALSGIDRTLADFGVDCVPLLASRGITLEQFNDTNALITLQDATILLEQSAELTGCRHFALELASRQDWALLGRLGLLLQTAKNVREALLDGERYLSNTHARAIQWTLGKHGSLDSYVLNLGIAGTSPRQTEMVVELALAQCYRVLQALGGGRLDVARICFRHRGPLDINRYREFFRIPVSVTAEIDGMLFAPGVLDIAVQHANPQMHTLIKRIVDQQHLPRAAESMAEEVRGFIRHLLPTGQCSIERIARCYACDKRTLQRYLRGESDTTFKDLLDEVRFEQAVYYLERSDLAMSELSQALGFSEPSNFARAFRNRFGCSPREWRKVHGRAGRRKRVLFLPR